MGLEFGGEVRAGVACWSWGLGVGLGWRAGIGSWDCVLGLGLVLEFGGEFGIGTGVACWSWGWNLQFTHPSNVPSTSNAVAAYK